MDEDFDRRFEIWWAAYPRRKTSPAIMGKKLCRERLLELLKKGEVSWPALMEGTFCYRDSQNVQDDFIKQPITFLRQAAWEDEYIDESETKSRFERYAGDWSDEDWDTEFGGDPSSNFRRDYIREYWNPQRLGPMPPHPQALVPQTIMQKYGRWFGVDTVVMLQPHQNRVG
jgi:hypothetical protein